MQARALVPGGTLGSRCAASMVNVLKMSMADAGRRGAEHARVVAMVDSNHRPQHYECCALTG